MAVVSGTPVTKSEIVAFQELDVRCDLTPQRADELALGQEADLWVAETAQPLPRGRLIYIGPVVDRNTGLVPLLVRVKNPDQRLGCGIRVSLQFTGGPELFDK
ncbi:MAG TPA: hypothetical protein VFG04_07450 [Planctomycetaceae bacterium]|nr:hypothetical protein [Planctomycetaceae bacterium]